MDVFKTFGRANKALGFDRIKRDQSKTHTFFARREDQRKIHTFFLPETRGLARTQPPQMGSFNFPNW
jgi:hypothetical protein